MRSIFFFRLALLNTFKKKLRLFLALVGISLTCGVIVVLFGLQTGLKNLVDTQIKNGQATNVVSVTLRNSNAVKLDSTRVSAIQSISGVGDVSESVGLLTNAVYHGITLNAPVYAVGSNYFTMNPPTLTKGTTEGQPSDDSIIVSTTVLSAFGIATNDALNKEIKLSINLTPDYANKLEKETPTKVQTFRIKGVIDRGSLPVIYAPLEVVKKQGLTSVSQLSIQLTSPDKAASVRETIERQGLQTSSIQDTIEQINKLFSVINSILIIFSIIVFIITVTAAFTVITLTLMEETQQIGFLRIMGLRRNDIGLLFVIQSMLITSIGATLGIVLGSIGGFALNGYAQALAATEALYGTISIFVLPTGQIIIILMLSIIIGWIVGTIPAKRAARLNPLEELYS
jgi:putative ABC transport system permease protein